MGANKRRRRETRVSVPCSELAFSLLGELGWAGWLSSAAVRQGTVPSWRVVPGDIGTKGAGRRNRETRSQARQLLPLRPGSFILLSPSGNCGFSLTLVVLDAGINAAMDAEHRFPRELVDC